MSPSSAAADVLTFLPYRSGSTKTELPLLL